MKVSKLSISAKKASVSDFLSGFLSSNSAEITEVTRYTLIFLRIFIYLLGMAYNGLQTYEVRLCRIWAERSVAVMSAVIRRLPLSAIASACQQHPQVSS